MCSLPVTGDTADLWVSTLHPLALLNSRIRFRGCLLLFACFCSCLGIFCVDCRYILSEFLKGNRVESFQNKSFWELPWLLLFSGSVFATPWTAARQASLSPSPGVCSNSCPLSQRCHLTVSSSVVPFSSCPQSLPASGSFQMTRLFVSGGQSTRAS